MDLYRRIFAACTACLLVVSLCAVNGCAPGQNSNSTKSDKPARYDKGYPIKSTVTVGMVADLVREIGGQHVQVKQMMGSGVDPHLYKPNRDDVQSVMTADIVFYNGLLLEGRMGDLLDRYGQSHPAVPVARDLKLPQDIVGNDAHHPDPHVWMDVSLWAQAATTVGQQLSQFDPPHAEEYQARATRLNERLMKLHEYGKTIISRIPSERRVLITSHDAFRYFGKAYGLEVQAIQGISTESEAGLQRINELVDLLVKRKIEAVFVESSVPQESIEALLEGARSRGHTVKIGGELFSDAMGEEGSYEGTYIGMMDHNLSTIARALGATNVEGFPKE